MADNVKKKENSVPHNKKTPSTTADFPSYTYLALSLKTLLRETFSSNQKTKWNLWPDFYSEKWNSESILSHNFHVKKEKWLFLSCRNKYSIASQKKMLCNTFRVTHLKAKIYFNSHFCWAFTKRNTLQNLQFVKYNLAFSNLLYLVTKFSSKGHCTNLLKHLLRISIFPYWQPY